MTQCMMRPSLEPSLCTAAMSTWNLMLRENMEVLPERLYSARKEVGDTTLWLRSGVCKRQRSTEVKGRSRGH